MAAHKEGRRNIIRGRRKSFREESFEKRRKKIILGNRVLTLEIDMVKGVAEFIQYWRA